MEEVGAYQAKTHLPRLLEKVRRGQSVTITKHGHPIARLVPIDDEERARQAANRIRSRRLRLRRAPLAELVASIHDGHRY